MKLSHRLETILSLVPKGLRTADIGTDHAYVPLALIERRIAPSVIATDLRPGPLANASDRIRKKGREAQVQLRLGDGLSPIRPGEAEVIIISGMGGALMSRILQEGRAVAARASRLILSPQSEWAEFRGFLSEEGYYIDEERCIEEEGKFYIILSVHPNEKQTLTKEELLYGIHTAPQDAETRKRLIERDIHRDQNLIKQISGKAGADTARIQIVKNRLAGAVSALQPKSNTKRKGRKD
ncbi:MAG: SAM-dependent methyltransferase [Lachnospiraceae bacterium]|nr:SAM-dependent methyltransferase [Lachnospiraceae bacterium]